MIAALALTASFAAQAELKANGPGGFTTSHQMKTGLAPKDAWKRLARVQDWWDSAHTYSGDAKNLRLALKPGGCWCEKTKGGFVKHGEVVFAQPGKTLRVLAAFGPLQEMAATGAYTVQVAAAEGGGSVVTFSYTVSGLDPAVVGPISKAVDGVMGQQAKRYAGDS
jgi:hypothetical protein